MFRISLGYACLLAVTRAGKILKCLIRSVANKIYQPIHSQSTSLILLLFKYLISSKKKNEKLSKIYVFGSQKQSSFNPLRENCYLKDFFLNISNYISVYTTYSLHASWTLGEI